MTKLNVPTSTNTMVHALAALEADATPDNNGAFSITGWNNKDWETFGLTIFTGDAALSSELAEAFNEVLRNHGRHHGANEAAEKEHDAAEYAAEVAADTRREEMAA